MPRFALLGKRLPHTFSPQYFQSKFDALGRSDCSYTAVELPDEAALKHWMEHEARNVLGFNITIPFKRSIVPMLDACDESAINTGVVNTVVCEKHGTKISLKGYNTDVTGFSAEIRPLLKPWMDRALILGRGASAASVAHVLQSIGLQVLFVSRNAAPQTLSWESMNDFVVQHHPLIVNTTPLGMYPEVELMPPLPLSALSPRHLVFDLIYNPAETKLLAAARNCGTMVQNGLGMLHVQADAAWKLWMAEEARNSH